MDEGTRSEGEEGPFRVLGDEIEDVVVDAMLLTKFIVHRNVCE
jgi:hypothetical protein